MIRWIKNLINLWQFSKDSRWFEKNPAAQVRFEDNEDWLEELEERVEKLETDSHPPKDLCEFESWDNILKRFEDLEKKIDGKF